MKDTDQHEIGDEYRMPESMKIVHRGNLTAKEEVQRVGAEVELTNLDGNCDAREIHQKGWGFGVPHALEGAENGFDGGEKIEKSWMEQNDHSGLS